MGSLVHLGRDGGSRAEVVIRNGTPGVSVATSSPRRRTAADVMTRFPPTVHQSASLWTAWNRMRETRAEHLVVVDDHRRPIDVLDERTVALEWPPGPLGPHRTPVQSVLGGRTRPRATSEDELTTIARMMLGARVDAVPVVDREGRLFGLVTLWHYAELAAASTVVG